MRFLTGRRRTLGVVLVVVLGLASLLFPASPRLGRADDDKKPPLPFVEGSWSLVLLPDTQYYSAHFPDEFKGQTEWIAKNKESHNIQYVFQLGDLTDNGSEKQFRRAREAMGVLNGNVPYVLAVGNHDYASQKTGSATTRRTRLNKYFSADDFKKWPTYGGLMRDAHLENSYHLFSAGGRDWIVLSLEWAPNDKTVDWANEILDKYPERKAILVTHAYLSGDGTRLDWTAKGKKQNANPHSYKTPDTMNDGEELWNKLVKKHDFAFVFCGHIGTNDSPVLSSTNDKGTTTHQILSDFQGRPRGGEGYMTLVEFLPDGKTVQIKNYSPTKDDYFTGAKQQYTLKLE